MVRTFCELPVVIIASLFVVFVPDYRCDSHCAQIWVLDSPARSYRQRNSMVDERAGDNFKT